MNVLYHSEADAEVIETAKFYSTRVPDLGADFLDVVDATVAMICESPDRFVVVDEGIRRCLLNRFPYAIYFRAESDTIRILAVAHLHRHPDYWKRRR